MTLKISSLLYANSVPSGLPVRIFDYRLFGQYGKVETWKNF